MQETRRYILEILKDLGQATVDEIVSALESRRGKPITAVTVRHHLTVLQGEGLVTEPTHRHRSAPGRPQHLYSLTDQALGTFPNNYQVLLSSLIDQVSNHLPPISVNVIFEGIAETMAAEAQVPDAPLEVRMDAVVIYLNQRGYEASWQHSDDGILLETSNCPYHNLPQKTDLLCEMDMHLIARLVGAAPRRLTRKSQGDDACTYFIPPQTAQ